MDVSMLFCLLWCKATDFFFLDYWKSEARHRSGIQIRKSKSGNQTLIQKRASSCVSCTQLRSLRVPLYSEQNFKKKKNPLKIRQDIHREGK